MWERTATLPDMYADGIVITAFPATWWEILTAIGTVAAAAAAVILGLHQSKTSERRQARELQRLEDERNEARAAQATAQQSEATRRREEQARQIGLWVVRTARDDATGAPHIHYDIKFANYSQAAIFDIAAFPEVSDNGLPVLPELQPGKHNYVPFDGGTYDMTFVITFRDIQGARWRRFEDGRLRAE